MYAILSFALLAGVVENQTSAVSNLINPAAGMYSQALALEVTPKRSQCRDGLLEAIGDAAVDEETNMYGIGHVCQCESGNNMPARSMDYYLTSSCKAGISAMRAGQSEAVTNEMTSLLMTSLPALRVKSAFKADAAYEQTSSFILSRLELSSILVCFLILSLGACTVLTWWPTSETPEADRLHDIDFHNDCQGFSSAFDRICADAAGQDFVGRHEEVEKRRRFRCQILTTAVIAALTILILTLWSSDRSGSLVLHGEGIHLFSDVVTYSVLLFAEVASSSWKGDSASYTFGYGRVEVLVSFVALSAQYFAMTQVLWSALNRLLHPRQLADDPAEAMMVVGISSFILNTGIGTWMHVKGICLAHDHSTEGGAAAAYAKLHMLCDAAQNLIVVVTGILLWRKPYLTMVEPICTLVFCGCFFYGTAGFMLQMIDILMERAPRNIDCSSIRADLCKIKGLRAVHCMHVWSVAPGKISVAAHLYTFDSNMNEDVLHQAQIVLQHRYGIKHGTFQVSDGE